MKRVYLDYLSTTPVDPRVLDAMLPYFSERFGHPASRGHPFGWEAEKALEMARAKVADLIGAEPPEIVFTSGGAEADNLAIKGVAEQLSSKGRHIVTTTVENRPVLDPMVWLERRGFTTQRVAPDGSGQVDPAAIEDALDDETILVSVQVANHEVGTLQPLAEIGALCADRGILFHTDASVAVPWLAIDVRELGIHLLSISGHRMYAPKGIGALFVNRKKPRVRLVPQIHGGGHEHGHRSGTVNVPGAVGLGVAAELCQNEREDDAARVAALRNDLEQTLVDAIADTHVIGGAADRLPNVTNLAFDYVEGEALVTGVPDVAMATGSACTSATPEPSHVLRAMGLPKDRVDASIRLSLGRPTTDDEVKAAAEKITTAVGKIRAISPAFAMAQKRATE